MTTTLAVLAKYNKNRGVISWTFQSTKSNSYQAVRDDGRIYPYTSIDSMREGYRKIRDEYHFTPLDVLHISHPYWVV